MTGEPHIVDRLASLAPGERVFYWTGYLARDRRPHNRADELGNIAYQHYQAGRVALVQRRLGHELWDYIAIGLPND